jgi:hypothetical protein
MNAMQEPSENQKAITAAICLWFPSAEIRRHDEGYFEARLDAELSELVLRLGKFAGLAYGPSTIGGCYVIY